MINHPNRNKDAKGKSAAEQPTEAKEQAVLVTTKHRGVFFGYANDVQGDIINLRAARNCLYWSADVKGFAGLAATGPSKSCRVGPAVDLQLRDITAVALVTEAAVAAWEAAPWK